MNGLQKSSLYCWLNAGHRRELQRRSFWAGSISYRTTFGERHNEYRRYLTKIPAQHSGKSKPESIVLNTPRARYNELIEARSLRDDEHQRYVIKKLQSLHDQLVSYDPPKLSSSAETSSMLYRLFFKEKADISAVPADQMPRGLYLYGDVGTGKSMLMDLFYATLPGNIKYKRRVHFHAFMIDVHKRIHLAKVKLGLDGGDPLLPVARDLAIEARVLCFDEFQVTDIADAMILRRLFENLLNYGVVFVMTSNRHPDELYKNGIQRSSFLPAIELMKDRLDIVNLDSGTDYRRIERSLSNCFYHPLNEENKVKIDRLYKDFLKQDGADVVYNRKLTIWGRTLNVPESTLNTAKFSFHELCGHPLSAADYLEVTKTFKKVFVLNIPKMDLGQKDMARRFITFIDACYENKTKLFCTSEVQIYQIFSDDNGNTSKDERISDHMRSVMDDLGLPASVAGISSIFTGDDEIFAFARCCSRLYQMSSRQWAEANV